MNAQLLDELAPTGVLRAAINMSNFLLVSGQTGTGEPDGVSPDLARAMAKELGVDVKLITYKGPGELADGIADNSWDIGNIAVETERAKTIHFSRPYCEIQATFLLPRQTELSTVESVDAKGIRIAVKARSAYDLWLTENFTHAELVRVETIDESFEVFVNEGLEALAGLRPKLVEQQTQLSGSTIVEQSFTSILQAVGCSPEKKLAAAFIDDFVAQAVGSGKIASLIEKHGVSGRLSVAAER